MKIFLHGLTLLILTMANPGLLTGATLADATADLLEKNLQTAFPGMQEDAATMIIQSGATALTLDEVLTIALRDNLGLLAKGSQLASKQASATASLRKMLPTVSLSSSRTDILNNTARYGSEAESFNSTLTLSQPIFRGGALWSGWQSAQTQESQAKLDLLHAARSLTKEIKTAWYALLEKQQLLKESESAMERLHQHEKNAKAFFREGRIWRNEVLQAGVKVAEGEQNLITARNQVELAISQLNRLMRRPLDHPLEPKGELAWAPLTWSLEDAYTHARHHRADLEKSRLNIQVGKMSEVATASATLPSVNFTGSYNVAAQDMHYQERESTMAAILSLNWTAWNWGETAQEVAAAKANTANNQLSYDDQLQSVLLETRRAFLNIKEADSKIKVIKKSLAQAEENYRVNQIRYREQLGSATDVLNAMDLLTSSRNSHTSALAAYLTALAALDLAVGKGVAEVEIKP